MNFVFRKKRLLLICLLHFVLAAIVSRSFFHPIIEHAGWENVAYQWASTGATMENDTAARLLCMVYSYALAFVFILLLWSALFKMRDAWISKPKTRICIILYFLVAAIGIIIIFGLYPRTVSNPPDTAYNYVYARQFMPMFWHGFLTNVLHCACMILFPHPLAMSIVPFLLGLGSVFYILYEAVVKRYRFGVLFAILFGLLLLYMPDIIPVFTYAGRNFNYALLSFTTLSLFLLDKMDESRLTWKKFFLLTVLICVLAAWRGEGIAYLAGFPFFLYCTYYKKDTGLTAGVLIRGLAIVVAVFLVLSLPDKYGSKKYQGYDYYIINTPGPLSAVWTNNPNTDFDSYEKDMETINKVVPLAYFEQYGEMAVQNYNWEQLRISRQCNAGELGKPFVTAAYDILLHNWQTYLKYQLYVCTMSNEIEPFFELNIIRHEKAVWTGEIERFNSRVMNYYTVGGNDFAQNHRALIINQKITDAVSSFVKQEVDQIDKDKEESSPIIRKLLPCLVLLIMVHALFSKRWLYFWMGGVITGILLLIILLAPAIRANYYYSTIFNQIFYILLWLLQLVKEKTAKQLS